MVVWCIDLIGIVIFLGGWGWLRVGLNLLLIKNFLLNDGVFF